MRKCLFRKRKRNARWTIAFFPWAIHPKPHQYCKARAIYIYIYTDISGTAWWAPVHGPQEATSTGRFSLIPPTHCARLSDRVPACALAKVPTSFFSIPPIHTGRPRRVSLCKAFVARHGVYVCVCVCVCVCVRSPHTRGAAVCQCGVVTQSGEDRSADSAGGGGTPLWRRPRQFSGGTLFGRRRLYRANRGSSIAVPCEITNCL